MAPRVTSDRDIYACARLLILQHGEQAGVHAAKKADALLKAGDLAGQNAWLRIARAIGDLQLTARPGDAPVH